MTHPDAGLLLLAPLAAPLVAAALAAFLGWRPLVARLTVGAAVLILATGIATSIATTSGPALTTAGGQLRADALSSVMLLVIGSVALIATWASISYVDDELTHGHTTAVGARRYATLVPLFLATMVLAVLADSLGVLWAAVEATTVVTAFLVGHRRTRGALEATWKYVMICSVGIALAYLGTVLVYFAARQADVGGTGSLDWTQLAAHADQLDPGVMRIAFALLVLGFGAKAGLVPLHSWLPDAHSQAPAPVSALMSGVLLSVAAYALLRYRIIAVASLDPAYVRGLLLTVALASLVLAASLLIAQRDYKRLLAYSSIEHMGLVALGAAAGTRVAITALLLHVLGHGLGKSVLFCASGQILALEGTTQIDGVTGLLVRRPALAGTFALGLGALLGLPPFALFASTLGIARATAAAGLGWALAVAVLPLLVIFIAIVSRTAPMILGSPAPGAPPVVRSPAAARALAPLVLGLVALAVIGLVGWPLQDLLRAAAAIVGSP